MQEAKADPVKGCSFSKGGRKGQGGPPCSWSNCKKQVGDEHPYQNFSKCSSPRDAKDPSSRNTRLYNKGQMAAAP